MSQKGIYVQYVIALESTAAMVAERPAEGIAPSGEASFNPVSVYLSRLSPSSQRTMQGALDQCHSHFYIEYSLDILERFNLEGMIAFIW